MKKLSITLLLLCVCCFGSFAASTHESESLKGDIEISQLTSLNVNVVSDNYSLNGITTLACGYSGNIINGEGVIVGHWYSSCVHREPTIIIVMCDEDAPE